MAKGELDEAVQWLEKAKRAPRYEPRHFPYMNLGRVYAAKGMVRQAIQELEEALRIAHRASSTVLRCSHGCGRCSIDQSDDQTLSG